MTNQTPDTIPAKVYYASLLSWPFRAIGSRVAVVFNGLFNGITGRWYCSHCSKWHGRRVFKFETVGFWITTYVCSLSKDRKNYTERPKCFRE